MVMGLYSLKSMKCNGKFQDCIISTIFSPNHSDESLVAVRSTFKVLSKIALGIRI